MPATNRIRQTTKVGKVLLGVLAFAVLVPVGWATAAIRSSAPSVRAGRCANPFAILAQGQPDVAFIGHLRLDGCLE
jgi:hypothetical protein